MLDPISSYVSHEKVKVDPSRNERLTDFGKATLLNRYLLDGEDFQDAFVRVASYFSDDEAHAQRMYSYISKLWFMPSTPVLSNGGTKRGLPISCFLNESPDSLNGIINLWVENAWLASRGGGIGSYWGNLRSIGEAIGRNGETSGVVPFMKVMDSLTLAISQGSLRRGSAAIYLPIWHPEIEEFIELRKPTGGDYNRKTLNIHHGVVITDDFMKAVEEDSVWELKSPKTGKVIHSLQARSLWIRLLTTRIETGEPYLLFIDQVNAARPQHQKDLGLNVKMSNLCSEITLPTGLDHLNNDRTAVCCLSSLNLEYFNEWKDEPLILEDCMRFLDNVLEDFIQTAPEEMRKAVYAAKRERSVGLGVMGFHSFLQGENIPFESVLSKIWNKKIFQHIRKGVDAASLKLGEERGPCLDALECGGKERFSNKIAIAPTASISIICGGTSPGIEPYAANSFTHKTLSGSFAVRNKHLKKLLIKKDKDNKAVWSSITLNEGSVQHLEFLSQDEKDVFKTAFELDQRWLVDLAADRTPYICQAQSLNLFLTSDVNKRDLHQVHFQAWKKGVKSLYYCRSKSIQRAESQLSSEALKASSNNYEECLACQ